MLVAGMISARDITWVTPPVLNIQNGCAHESKLHTQALVTNIDFAILIFRNQYVWQEPVLYGYLLHWFIIYFLIIWNSWNRKKDRNAFHHFGSVRFRDYGPVLSVYRVPVYSPNLSTQKLIFTGVLSPQYSIVIKILMFYMNIGNVPLFILSLMHQLNYEGIARKRCLCVLYV